MQETMEIKIEADTDAEYQGSFWPNHHQVRSDKLVSNVTIEFTPATTATPANDDEQGSNPCDEEERTVTFKIELEEDVEMNPSEDQILGKVNQGASITDGDTGAQNQCINVTSESTDSQTNNPIQAFSEPESGSTIPTTNNANLRLESDENQSDEERIIVLKIELDDSEINCSDIQKASFDLTVDTSKNNDDDHDDDDRSELTDDLISYAKENSRDNDFCLEKDQSNNYSLSELVMSPVSYESIPKINNNCTKSTDSVSSAVINLVPDQQGPIANGNQCLDENDEERTVVIKIELEDTEMNDTEVTNGLSHESTNKQTSITGEVCSNIEKNIDTISSPLNASGICHRLCDTTATLANGCNEVPQSDKFATLNPRNEGDNINFKSTFAQHIDSDDTSASKKRFLRERNTDVKCKICDEKFANQSLLTTHMTSLHSKNKKDFLCDVCNEKFQTKNELEKHEKKQHPNSQPSYTCQFCDRPCSSLTDLEKHRYYVHLQKKESKCELCRKEFITTEHLEKHRVIVHNGTSGFKCDLCDTVALTAKDLERHKQRRHGLKRQFKCDICKKDFMTKEQFEKHTKKGHKRSFNCEFCETSFYYKSSRTAHVMTDHKDKQKQKFRCVICDKVSFDFESAKSHVLSDHSDLFPSEMRNHMMDALDQEELEPSLNKIIDSNIVCEESPAGTVYKCRCCETSFGERCHLEAHIVIHHLDKLYFKCKDCGKEFYSPKNFATTFVQNG